MVPLSDTLPLVSNTAHSVQSRVLHGLCTSLHTVKLDTAMLCAVCCMLYAVCCTLYAACCMLCTVCCMLYAVRCALLTTKILRPNEARRHLQ